MSGEWVNTGTQEICPECGASLQCLAGSSAHPNNWHCAKECGWQAWTSTKPPARLHRAKPAQAPEEPTPTERLHRKLASAVWICSFGEQCGIKAKHQLTDAPLEDIHVRKEAAELLISVLAVLLKALPPQTIEQIATSQSERLSWIFEPEQHSESNSSELHHQPPKGDCYATDAGLHHPHPPSTPADK